MAAMLQAKICVENGLLLEISREMLSLQKAVGGVPKVATF